MFYNYTQKIMCNVENNIHNMPTSMQDQHFLQAIASHSIATRVVKYIMLKLYTEFNGYR